MLKLINKECSSGSFKVVEIKELISLMPNKFKVDSDTIEQIIHALKRDEYVDVKYYDDEVYCVCPLPKGRYYYENKIEEKQNNNKIKKILIKYSFFYLLFSILGGFLGNLIYKLIFK